MKKITDFIVEKRNIFLIIFIIFAIISLYLSTKVKINEDIMKYLPSNSETKIGKDIMDNKFEEQDSSTLNVMFKNLSYKEKINILNKLKEIKGVETVDYDNTEKYNKGIYTLYEITVNDYDHSKTASNVYNTVKNKFKYTAMNGTIYEENKPILQKSIVVISITSALIILIILSESYIEPFLYLISIGIAVFINKGTNTIFNSVSSITDSITAILQLALSMDYSIMLSNRFKQEKEKTNNKVVAMKNALFDSFKSISSSSITTIVGLLALIFMSFTIGKDLGIVLSKGVLLSLICIFFCLPSLLLLFDNSIVKTHKKTPKFNLEKLGKFSYKTRWLQVFTIILLFGISYFLQGNIKILYTGSEQDEVGKIFPATNQMAIVYKNNQEDIIKTQCKNLEQDSKIDKVLCYSNTINQKLYYDELNDKLDNLGIEASLDNDLIKIVYYDYYNKNNDYKITLNEFINFIKNEIYNNNKFNKYLNSDIKKNIETLSYFSNKEEINKKRNIKEISNILGINVKDASNLLIYYNSKSINTKLTIKQFIDFILDDVLNNKDYSNQIDKETINNLKRLRTFTKESVINKKMNSKELSDMFKVDSNLIEQLLLFNRINSESKTKLTLNTFSETALYLSNDNNYKSLFNINSLKSLEQLNFLSNEKNISNNLNIDQMNEILEKLEMNLDKETIKSLYILYDGYNTDTKITLKDFATTALELSKNEKFSDSFNIETISKLNTIVNLTTYSDTKMKNKDIFSLFNITDKKKIYTLGILLKPFDGYLTPKKFVNTILNSKLIKKALTEDEINDLTTAKFIMDNSNTLYSRNELKEILDQDITTINYIFGMYDYKNNNIKNISIKSLITFIYENKSIKEIKPYLENKESVIKKAYIITNNINTKYNYKEISNIIQIDKNITNKIYGIYDYLNYKNELSPYELVSLIWKNKNNELLKDKLNSSILEELNIANITMTSTIANKKYQSKELSNILNVDNKKLSLLYSLYDSTYINKNNKVSLNNYINFIISDVINDKDFSNKFNNNSKSKLITISKIISNSLNEKKYSSKELTTLLKNLNKTINFDLIDLIYTYNGSINKYNNNYQMTIEELINYLNTDIVNNLKYKDFINDSMNNKIIESKNLINKSKGLIVSDNYSRAVLNTKYSAENKDTYNFINNLKNNFKDKKGIYVVGNSPMAVEMNETFSKELNKITLLTMIFIFIVVAITFKDLLIPLILVLIIQCAVYMTMSFISITGGSVFFISLLIVQAILMGATIDYAIVYTSYYKESRKKLNVKESIINAYNKSIHTIISSASVLIIVTLIVANFASAIAAKICETISQGTFISALLILLILPGVLASFDKLICRDIKKK